MITKQLLGFSLVAMLACDVQATTITYSTTDLGFGAWQYDYSLTNNTLSFPIEEFTIYFPLGLYSNLSSVSAPLDWTNLIAQPDPGLPADGFLDSFTLSAAILPGQTLDPFSVQFVWLGSGVPGGQSFEIIDPIDFTVLDSGSTIPHAPPSGVPEPGTIPLAFLGITVLLGLSRCRRFSRLPLASTRNLP